ncbi:amidase [Vibrio sp. WXL103]|uniref:amidase n=1 Tax=Vibrio sp. WXL103 TaxID=3450710 RepID=UPI003EC88E19
MKFKYLTALLSIVIVGCNSDSNAEEESVQGRVKAQELISLGKPIEDIHEALMAGETTCEDLVSFQLERISSMDRKGPELNSYISVNENAIEVARELDHYYSHSGLKGNLHCITVAVKDNVNTHDMPTTGGALANNQPMSDAFIVKKVREAGGVVIGKANLHEFAFGIQGGSSLGGIPRNVYDLSKGPGGSSSGTGTAVSANLAMIGIGTDTGGSIRVPASVQALIGLRPSLRLVSQEGIMPLSPFQDTAGPMCRSVSDCATFLETLVGYDKSSYSGQRYDFDIDSQLMSNSQQYNMITGAGDYVSQLDVDKLNGARVGIVREMFGDGQTSDNIEVQRILEQAIDKMKQLGAIVDDVSIPDLYDIATTYTSLSRYEFYYSLTDYLQTWPSDKDFHYRSADEVYASGEYLESSEETFAFYTLLGSDRWNDQEYTRNVFERPDVIRGRLDRALDNKDENGDRKGLPFDVLIYPTITGYAGPHGDNPTSAGFANRLSAFTGYPALTMPVGYTEIKGEKPLPVGLEMIAREFDESTLLSIAYAYEKAYRTRIEPILTPSMEPSVFEPMVKQSALTLGISDNETLN